MPDFFKKCHLNSKKCFVLFQTKCTTLTLKYAPNYQQQVILNNCLFIKLGVKIKLRSCKFVADAILAEQEKELPANHPYLFSVGVSTSCNGNRQSTHPSNTTQVHSQVTLHAQTVENNQNCEILGLFILLSTEIWITVMKNDGKC